ncbi:MAG: hypothetical protein JW726_09965 [Anaerolineales bacterium]|nr:hypothetical protein [Anaerolineales bacterium]
MLRRPTQPPAKPEPAIEAENSSRVSQVRRRVAEYYGRARNYYERSPRLQRFVWQRKFSPAFWTISSILSLSINIILIAVLILMGRQLFALKEIIEDDLLGKLHDNFALMDEAHILTTVSVATTIEVKDEIPVVFDLPLSQATTVILTQDTEIPGTWVALDTAGSGIYLSIDAPADITLPEGTPLGIQLDLVVPVSQTVPVVLNVPVNLTVPVDIPLNQTELHDPFVGLQGVVAPYQLMLQELPNSWEETPLCGPLTGWICSLFFGTK